MKVWGKTKSIDNLSNRLGTLEKITSVNQKIVSRDTPYATAEELDQMTDSERLAAWFNWHVKEVMPAYKAEVMRHHNISTDEEYSRRVLEGDQSIYLPQPNNKFEATWYKERVAHVLGLDYQGLQDKIKRGEIEDKIATGRMVLDPKTGEYTTWLDENPVVF